MRNRVSRPSHSSRTATRKTTWSAGRPCVGCSVLGGHEPSSPARFAASKRAHYIDLRGVIGLEDAIAKAVGEVGPVVLMGGGYCPGAVAPPPSHAAKTGESPAAPLRPLSGDGFGHA